MPSARRKKLGYRDQGNASLAAHAAHWQGFTFEGGPFKVQLHGQWGSPQVWASSEAEGRRVLLHAASIAGYNPATDPDAEWTCSEITNGRHPAGRTFRVRITPDQLVDVTKRDGPNGSPLLVPA